MNHKWDPTPTLHLVVNHSIARTHRPPYGLRLLFLPRIPCGPWFPRLFLPRIPCGSWFPRLCIPCGSWFPRLFLPCIPVVPWFPRLFLPWFPRLILLWFGLGDQRKQHVAVHVGQAVIATLETVGQFRMVETHKVHPSGLKIMNMDRVFNHRKT